MRMQRIVIVVLAVAALAAADVSATMLRRVYLFDSPETTPSFDRWYFTTHSQEVVRMIGPWLRRYWSFRLFDVPGEASRFNVRRARMTELYMTFEDLQESRGERLDSTGNPIPDGWWLNMEFGPTGVALVAATPTEDFFNRDGREPTLGGLNFNAPRFCRWMVMIKYPDRVSYEEGERWYVEVHGPELAKKLPGLVHFVSHGIPEKLKDRYASEPGYIRLSELWFASYGAWSEALLDPSLELTPPPWAPDATKLEEFYEVVTGFVGIWPDVDFLHDRPRIP